MGRTDATGGIVAVTGATGHLGGNLVRALLARGRVVRAVLEPGDRQPTLQGLPVEAVTGDVRDASSLAAAFDGADVVYHLAGYVSLMPGREEMLRAINVDGVRNVVSACLGRRVKRLVHVSSIQALSPLPIDAVVDESRPSCLDLDVPPYDRSKAAGELEVSRGCERGLEGVVVSPTAIVGPYDFRPSRQGALFLSLCRGRLPAIAPIGFNWVDARDVAAGAIAAERRGRTGARYLLGGHWRSLRELALEFAKVTGVAAPRFEVPFALARVAAPFSAAFAALTGGDSMFTPYAIRGIRHYRHVSIERATRELDYRPRPIEETVAAIVEWFRAAGWLPAVETTAGACMPATLRSEG